MSEARDADTPRDQEAKGKKAGVRVKICGVRDVETALHAARCGADFVGLVFVEASVRHVADAEAATVSEALRRTLPSVGRAGLFADASLERVLQTVAFCGLDVVQLHGQETPTQVEALRAQLPGGVRIWKALPFDAEAMEVWRGSAAIDALLLDAPHRKGELSGGTGRTADWDALAKVDRAGLPGMVLAGGLSPANVAEAIRVVRPWGVDVSSGVESSRGVKDLQKIEAFCDALRDA